jgi:hypothetical protein
MDLLDLNLSVGPVVLDDLGEHARFTHPYEPKTARPVHVTIAYRTHNRGVSKVFLISVIKNMWICKLQNCV